MKYFLALYGCVKLPRWEPRSFGMSARMHMPCLASTQVINASMGANIFKLLFTTWSDLL